MRGRRSSARAYRFRRLPGSSAPRDARRRRPIELSVPLSSHLGLLVLIVGGPRYLRAPAAALIIFARAERRRPAPIGLSCARDSCPGDPPPASFLCGLPGALARSSPGPSLRSGSLIIFGGSVDKLFTRRRRGCGGDFFAGLDCIRLRNQFVAVVERGLERLTGEVLFGRFLRQGVDYISHKRITGFIEFWVVLEERFGHNLCDRSEYLKLLFEIYC